MKGSPNTLQPGSMRQQRPPRLKINQSLKKILKQRLGLGGGGGGYPETGKGKENVKKFEDALTKVFIFVSRGQDNLLSMRGVFAGHKCRREWKFSFKKIKTNIF